MKDKLQHPSRLYPKRLRSLMVIVAVCALTFQMVRGVASRSTPGVARLRPAGCVRSYPGPLAQPIILPPTIQPPTIPRPERPFHVVDGGRDEAFLKIAPEGIDDKMIFDPPSFEKR